MKYYGDIPQQHLDLVKELETLEDWFDAHGSSIPNLSSAKGFCCMAHDFYHMDMEETGERLLLRADDISPGYFKIEIHDHIKSDKEFAQLIKQLKKTLALEVIISLGYDK